MDMIKRRDAGFAYISDENVFKEQAETRRILQKLNFMDRSDFDGIAQIVKELLGKSENAFINPTTKPGRIFCPGQTHLIDNTSEK